MYEYVTDFTQMGRFVSALGTGHQCLAFDVETTGKDFFKDKLLLMQVKIEDTAFVFDCRKLGEKLCRYIADLLQSSSKTLVGHNIKFDIKMVMTNCGVLLTNIVDVMLAEIMITNGLATGKERYFSLNDLTEKYCNVTLDKTVREAFYMQENPVITEREIIYSAEDVEYLLAIREQQLNILKGQGQLKAYALECLLTPVIASMELEGVLLDVDHWKSLLEVATQQMHVYEKELIDEMLDKALENQHFNNALELADFLHIPVKTKRDRAIYEQITELDFVKDKIKTQMNINSPPQLLVILRDVYHIPVESTGEKVINKFEIEYPIISKILKFREHCTKVEMFGEPTLNAINPITGRIHTEFNQLGMVSGRIASQKPNLQQIPREQEYRKAFIARPGKKIVATDFSQEELRLLSVIAKVKGMIQAYKDNKDLHAVTGAGLAKVSVETVTKDQRNKGKSMNFAVGYGSTEWGLWKNFGIPLDEGRKYLKTFYNELYPEINQAKNVVLELIQAKGYSTTLLGRKRFFELKSFFPGGMRERERFFASILREGFNHIVQGTGAEIMKKSLVRIFYENPFGKKLKILIQVYDEIVCEADDDIAKEAEEFVCKIMLECEREYLKDVVPAQVDSNIGDFWIHK